jgi:hypothetical protein
VIQGKAILHPFPGVAQVNFFGVLTYFVHAPYKFSKPLILDVILTIHVRYFQEIRFSRAGFFSLILTGEIFNKKLKALTDPVENYNILSHNALFKLVNNFKIVRNFEPIPKETGLDS